MKILLSMHKRYVDKMISGEKTFELRRRFTKRKVNRLYIYETAPTKRVVAKANINKVHKLPLNLLWNLTKDGCGITKKEFFEYFKELDYGYAIELNNFNEYKNKKHLSSFNIKFPPQSFRFIKS